VKLTCSVRCTVRAKKIFLPAVSLPTTVDSIVLLLSRLLRPTLLPFFFFFPFSLFLRVLSSDALVNSLPAAVLCETFFFANRGFLLYFILCPCCSRFELPHPALRGGPPKAPSAGEAEKRGSTLTIAARPAAVEARGNATQTTLHSNFKGKSFCPISRRSTHPPVTTTSLGIFALSIRSL
jgi:hypothetical protein